MRLVRIDRVAPGGVALDLHPRMTVLTDAPPELRRRLHEVFRSFSSDAAPGHAGLLEVNGVRLTLDRATLDQLQLDAAIDPVLAFGRPGDGVPRVAHVDRSLVREQLRARLRAVSARRNELAELMRRRRDELEPHAGNAVEVCLGQIEALETRRTAVRAEWEQERAEQGERRRALLLRREQLGALLERIDRIDAAEVAAASEALVRAVEPPSELDPVAAQLADRLERQLGELRELVGRRASLELREREAAQRLDEAVAATRSAETRNPASTDAGVVSRLEQVRDEIFSVGDRSGRLGGSRSKRRLSELRAEEAVLLDRLGYETYSAYVMGIPSLRAEMERSNRIDSAQNRSERIEAELEDLRADLPDPTAIRRTAAELLDTLTASLQHLGDPRPLGVDDVVLDATEIERQHAELVYAVVTELRQRRISAPTEDAPHVLIAIDRVRRALFAVTSDWPGERRSAETEGIGAFELGTPPSAPGPLLAVARDWISWYDGLGEAVIAARGRHAAIESELAALEGAGPASHDTTRWAEVEAELDAALDRLSAAQERVRLHDAATAAVAALREEELTVRDEERRLLTEIAAADGRDGSAAPTDPDAQPGPPPYRPDTIDAALVRTGGSTDPRADVPTDAPHDGGLHGGGPHGASAEDAAWRVVAHLAEQRSVSFAGSVPVLVDGLPAGSEAAAAVVGRLHAMSDLVQVVLLAGTTELTLDPLDLTSATVTAF